MKNFTSKKKIETGSETIISSSDYYIKDSKSISTALILTLIQVRFPNRVSFSTIMLQIGNGTVNHKKPQKKFKKQTRIKTD